MWNRTVILAIVVLLTACSDKEQETKGASDAAPVAEASITIVSPAEGAMLDTNSVEVEYEVMPSQQGDHVHLYVDNRKPDILRKLKGKHMVTDLDTGKHTIVIKEVNAGHTATGHEATVNVVVQ